MSRATTLLLLLSSVTPAFAQPQPVAGECVVDAQGADADLDCREQVTVTDSREERLKSETPVSVGVLSRARITDVKPTHPSQLMGRVPGVWVNTTGGEGHMTAIRQPLTTSPVYLYLEDGVPTRSKLNAVFRKTASDRVGHAASTTSCRGRARRPATGCRTRDYRSSDDSED